MTDEEALELLRLLHKYVQEYSPDIPQTIAGVAEDLARSDCSGLDEVQDLWQGIKNAPGVLW